MTLSPDFKFLSYSLIFHLCPQKMALMHDYFNIIENIYVDTELALHTSNTRPYFSLKNLGQNSAHCTGKIWCVPLGCILCNRTAASGVRWAPGAIVLPGDRLRESRLDLCVS